MRFDGGGCEQKGLRPGLIFQNNTGNQHSPNVIALPLTTSVKKLRQPTHVLLPASKTGLRYDSVVLCENPERMSKDKIGKYLTTLPDEYIANIAVASLLASSIISYLTPEELISVWKAASELNTA